jgi:hypothetical protein
MFRSAIARWISAAQRTASTRLAEFDQRPVTCGFEDATAMLGNVGIAYLASNRPQCRQSALFIGLHQPGIANDIGRQNGRQPSFDPAFGHRLPRLKKNDLAVLGHRGAVSARNSATRNPHRSCLSARIAVLSIAIPRVSAAALDDRFRPFSVTQLRIRPGSSCPYAVIGDG